MAAASAVEEYNNKNIKRTETEKMTNRCRDMGKDKEDKELENSVQTCGR